MNKNKNIHDSKKNSKSSNQIKPFWKEKTLNQMNSNEWEALCSGCGKCCVQKIQYPDKKDIKYTNICCYLLCPNTCRCTAYEERNTLVPSCMSLTPLRVKEYDWLPETCSYRLLLQKKELPWWHHLVSGDQNLIHLLGHSVKGKVVSEEYIHDLQLNQHIIEWINKI